MGAIRSNSLRMWVGLFLVTRLCDPLCAAPPTPPADDVVPLDPAGLLESRKAAALENATTLIWRDWDGSYYVNLSTCFGIVTLASYQRTPQGFHISKLSEYYKGPVGLSATPPLYQRLSADRSALLEPNARTIPPFLLRFFGVTLNDIDRLRKQVAPPGSPLSLFERDSIASSLLIARSPRKKPLLAALGRQTNLTLEELAAALNGSPFARKDLKSDESYAFLQLLWALNYMRAHGYHLEAGTLADELIFSYLLPA